MVHEGLEARDLGGVYRLVEGRGLVIYLTESIREAHMARAREYAGIPARSAGCAGRQ
ncbi:hypothetical protein [Stetteria hydrogenophila]